MRKVHFVLFAISVFASQFSISQNSLPLTYYKNIKMADSLVRIESYDSAILHYREAFKSSNGRGMEYDRYNFARIWGLKKNVDSLKIYLHALVNDQRYFNYLNFLTDSAFSFFRYSAEFNGLVASALINKNKYAPLLNLEWSVILENVYKSDQQRPLIFERDSQADSVRRNDSLNTIIVTSFLDNYGWCGEDIIGSIGNKALFLVVQHSSSSTRQKYFPQLKEAVEKGNATTNQLALMEDRILLETKGYQLYGTQLIKGPEDTIPRLQPILDEKNVDVRRRKLGLKPLKEYLLFFGVEYVLPK